MTNNTNIVRETRALMPVRPLTLNDAFHVAEVQAAKLLDLLSITSPSVPIARLADLPKIDVEMHSRLRMPGLSGFSKWADGRWLIVINKNQVPGRRRFTLAHEFKHVLDHCGYDVTYRDLGNGDPTTHDRQIELICNYFAACFLMPAPWVKRSWRAGIRDEEALAGLFGVSREAIHNRLIYLGYVGDDRRPLAEYLRADHPRASETVAA